MTLYGHSQARCLAVHVGKPSHSYHPEGLYTAVRSPGGGEGGSWLWSFLGVVGWW